MNKQSRDRLRFAASDCGYLLHRLKYALRNLDADTIQIEAARLRDATIALTTQVSELHKRERETIDATPRYNNF